MRQGFFDKFVAKLDRIDAPVATAHINALAQERGFLETLFQSIDEGLMVVGEALQLLYANHAAERMLGFSSDKERGKSVARYIREWGVEALLQTQMGDWSRIETHEVELFYPEHRVVTYYARPVEFEERTELLLILRDVTRERRAEEHALADERLTAVKTLAAGVAHEIGNPLNALTIHLQLLERELRNVKEAEQRSELQALTTVAAQEVKRLDGILRRFLSALRPTQVTLVKGDVRTVIETTLKLLAFDLEQRRIQVQTAIPDHVPKVFLDTQQLEQVFFNLIKNAMDAVPDGGRIGVTITVDDTRVNVSILDNGEGIPEAMLGRIFDPYVTTKAKGNGLGLMVVKKIIQAHKGTIACASHPGEGTCFTIHLPRAKRHVRALESSTESKK